MLDLRKYTKPRSEEKKQEKEIVLQNLYKLFEGKQKILNAFESKIFLVKSF